VEPGEMSATSPAARRLVLQLGAAMVARLVLNTSRRMPYTFAPALSRGLGVPLTAITSLIAINQATSLLGPFLGPLGDRWGYRVMMLAGLGLLGIGMLAGGLLPIYVVLAVAVMLAGFAKILFDPAIQAYAGEHVSFANRGLAIGLIELSWAGSTLVGIPLVGLLMDRTSWHTPFLVLGGLALLSLVLVAVLIPGDHHRVRRVQSPATYRRIWHQIRRKPAVWGIFGFTFLSCAANDCVFVVYGTWLESTFGLTVLALGTATTVIGLAELLGEVLVASTADRLGLRRAAIGGMVFCFLSYLLLPFTARTLPLALAGLFFIFLTFEYTIVTTMSIVTEVLPGARGTMMSSNLSAAGMGRVTGSLMGGAAWLAGGLTANGLAAAAASGLALFCLAWGLSRWRKQRRAGLAKTG
jgi:MFS transporter, DHA1 family, inner membrane transport protein